jgi:hypothetical protein
VLSIAVTGAKPRASIQCRFFEKAGFAECREFLGTVAQLGIR